MISRLSACAAIFAVLVTTGLAVAADGHQQRSAVSATAMPSITLPRVEITGHRLASR